MNQNLDSNSVEKETKRIVKDAMPSAPLLYLSVSLHFSTVKGSQLEKGCCDLPILSLTFHSGKLRYVEMEPLVMHGCESACFLCLHQRSTLTRTQSNWPPDLSPPDSKLWGINLYYSSAWFLSVHCDPTWLHITKCGTCGTFSNEKFLNVHWPKLVKIKYTVNLRCFWWCHLCFVALRFHCSLGSEHTTYSLGSVGAISPLPMNTGWNTRAQTWAYHIAWTAQRFLLL